MTLTTRQKVNGKGSASEIGAEAEQIQIGRIKTEIIRVPIVGTAPLIIHAFSDKAKRQMLDAMQGKKSPKEPKNPEAEFKAAFYRLPDGQPGFPVLGFKQATIGGARFFGKQITMTLLRQCIFFIGEPDEHGNPLARIEGEAQMREDVVRVARGGTDLRYRPIFLEWRTSLHVVYVPSMLTRDSVLSLMDAGGMGVGVGEWRPEKNGAFGTYQLDESREIEVVS